MKLSKESRSRLIKLLLLSGAVLVVGLSYYFAVRALGGGIPCIVYTLTGTYCPGCGITRMFVSLISGDIVSAVRYNLLVMILLPFFVLFGTVRAVDYVRNGGTRKKRTAETAFLWTALALTFVFWILRNIEFFSFLAP